MLAGVAAGIARYLGVDVTVVRIVFAVLAVVGGAGVPLYLAGWLLIPEEGSSQSIAGGFVQSRQARSH
jgi:phage shock protein PspC (stress-responsive transcriptional regulator)